MHLSTNQGRNATIGSEAVLLCAVIKIWTFLLDPSFLGGANFHPGISQIRIQAFRIGGAGASCAAASSAGIAGAGRGATGGGGGTGGLESRATSCTRRS